MKRKKYFGTALCFALVCILVFSSLSYSQDKKTVQMDSKEYAEYRLGKIQQEIQAIVADLRAKNPEQYKRLDSLSAEGQQIQQDYQKTQAPAKPPAKK